MLRRVFSVELKLTLNSVLLRFTVLHPSFPVLRWQLCPPSPPPVIHIWIVVVQMNQKMSTINITWKFPLSMSSFHFTLGHALWSCLCCVYLHPFTQLCTEGLICIRSAYPKLNRQNSTLCFHSLWHWAGIDRTFSGRCLILETDLSFVRD